MLAGAARPLGEVLVDQLGYIRSVTADSVSIAALAGMENQAKEALKPTAPDSLMIMGMSVAYLRDLDRRDVVGAATKLTMPVFVAQGGRDYQATAEDLDLWKKALAANPKATFKLYPDLDHLFHKGTAKARPEDYMKPALVAPELIQDLAGWISGGAK
jgi:pimeloyl-ACP methyl ester carboxylesterase